MEPLAGESRNPSFAFVLSRAKPISWPEIMFVGLKWAQTLLGEGGFGIW